MDDETKRRWVRGLYARGIPSPAIGPVLGLSRGQVQRILWRSRAKAPPRRAAWKAEEVELVCNLWRAGATLDQIVDACGRGRNAVYYRIQQAGLARYRQAPAVDLKAATVAFSIIRDRRGI